MSIPFRKDGAWINLTPDIPCGTARIILHQSGRLCSSFSPLPIAVRITPPGRVWTVQIPAAERA